MRDFDKEFNRSVRNMVLAALIVCVLFIGGCIAITKSVVENVKEVNAQRKVETGQSFTEELEETGLKGLVDKVWNGTGEGNDEE